jgi:hypothetical protein
MGPKDMAADHAHRRPPAPPLNHELSDADPAPILKFLAFLVAATIVIALLVVPFYNYLERREAAEKTARHPMSLTGVERPQPPPPRLQTYPFQDIKALRQHDKPLVGSYEWVDRNAGTVRIPIDRAMDLLAQRGLPYRKGGQPSAAAAAGAGERRIRAIGRPAHACGKFEWAAANDCESAEAEALTRAPGSQSWSGGLLNRVRWPRAHAREVSRSDTPGSDRGGNCDVPLCRVFIGAERAIDVRA